jgi:hypothetical protein
MLSIILRSRYLLFIAALLGFVTTLWYWPGGYGISQLNQIMVWSYDLPAIAGAIYAAYISIKVWGGWNSVIGKFLLLMSAALFAEWIGSKMWDIYQPLVDQSVNRELFNIGYYLRGVLFAVASFVLCRLLVATVNKAKIFHKAMAVLLMVVFGATGAAVAYINIAVVPQAVVDSILAALYALGEGMPVFIMGITMLLVRGKLGGLMQSRLRIVMLAYIFQYFVDTMQLLISTGSEYKAFGWADYVYMLSYFMLAVMLSTFSSTKEKG